MESTVSAISITSIQIEEILTVMSLSSDEEGMREDRRIYSGERDASPISSILSIKSIDSFSEIRRLSAEQRKLF